MFELMYFTRYPNENHIITAKPLLVIHVLDETRMICKMRSEMYQLCLPKYITKCYYEETFYSFFSNHKSSFFVSIRLMGLLLL